MRYSSPRGINGIDNPAKEQITGCPNPVASRLVYLSFSSDSQGAVPTMKRSFTAAFLSAIIPGAGLWYLGRRGPAICNFLFAVSIPLICLTAGFFSEHILWIFLAIAAGSAGLAHSQA
jgi:TM2 domain-containing membrane protein YozV